MPSENKQRNIYIILGAVGLVGFITVLLGLGTVMGFYNGANGQEKGLTAQYEQNKNNYSSYFNKIKELAQVPEQYAADLEKVYAGALTGRYGKDGSKAVFQFLKEQNPQLDAGLYGKISQAIEAGRNAFEADQKSLIDKKRVYDTYLTSFPNNILAGAFGFPRIKLSDLKIVTNEETETAFTTGKAGPIQIRETAQAKKSK